VVSAPSGAGKTTLVERIRRTPSLFYSVSCTTRAPRTGEIDGQDYQFLSDADFRERIEKGDFLEHAHVHGDYYGTLREPVVTNLKRGKDVLIDIDTQGAAVIRNCGDPLIRDTLADVFIMPPDLEELRKRLLKRGRKPRSRSIRAWPPLPGRWNTGATIVILLSVDRLRKTCRGSGKLWRQKAIEPAFDREMIAEGRDSKRKRDKASARKVVRIRPGTKSVVLGVTGSIAAYKSAELASLLVKQGHEVFVVMTRDATEFISPLTLQTLSKIP